MAFSLIKVGCFLISYSFIYKVSALEADSTCYSINGEPNSDFPCFLGQSVSACCGDNSICLDTGLCKPIDSVGVSELIRGSCTDQTWESSSCPDFCVDAVLGGTNLISCQNVTNDQRDFCCDHDANCCDSGIGRFRVQGAFTPVVTISTEGPEVTRIQPSTASSTQITSSSTPTSKSSSSTSTSPTATNLSSTTGKSSYPSQTAARPSETASQTAASIKATDNTPIKIGIGVGVAGGVLAIVAVVMSWYVLRRRKRAQLLESGETSPVDYPRGIHEAEAQGKTAEMGANYLPAELRGVSHYPPVEMPGSSHWGKG